MAIVSDERLDMRVRSADHRDVKLQMTAGAPTWEMMPSAFPAAKARSTFSPPPWLGS